MHLGILFHADDKDMARYLVAKIMWEELQKYPSKRTGFVRKR